MWFLLASAVAGSVFTDVTESVGLGETSPSFGMALADIDHDGWMDIYLTNHANPPSMFLQRDGRFVRTEGITGRLDAHGVVVADLNFDGRRDVFEAHGAQRAKGAVANRAWIASDDGFADQAVAMGLALPEAPARMPLAYDADGDGWTDLYVAAAHRADGAGPSALFFGGPDGWSKPMELPASIKTGMVFAADTRGDARPELHLISDQTLTVLTASREGWESWSMELPPSGRKVGGFAPMDVDADGHMDIVLLPTITGSDVWQDDNELRIGHLGKLPKGMRASFTGGVLTVDVGPRHEWKPDQVLLGSSCTPATGFPLELKARDALGMCPPGGDQVRIGRVKNQWIVSWGSAEWKKMLLTIRSPKLGKAKVSGLPSVQTAKRRAGQVATILMGTEEGFVAAEDARGLPPLGGCAVPVPIDVDADGDEDLLVGCRSVVFNTPNRLFRNDDGRFTEVLDHGGEGTTEGVVDRFAVGDHDRDGIPEVVAINGEGGAPWVFDGPVTMIEAQAPAALRLDVRGGDGNIDALGATVEVMISKGRVIRRHVGLGSWCAQHDHTLLVGLDGAPKAKKVTVRWPDGRSRTFRRLKPGVDHVLEPK